MDIEDNQSYQGEVFDWDTIEKDSLRSCYFEDCAFLGGRLSKIEWTDCRFTDCRFVDVDLSLARFPDSRMYGIEFSECKMVGIDWALLDSSNILVSAPFSFASCDLSFSNFSEMKLIDMIVHDCKVHEADFTECDLSKSDFYKSDLLGSRFMRSKLSGANFEEAFNYQIDPSENSIVDARFSFPEVLGLLSSFQIKIAGIE